MRMIHRFHDQVFQRMPPERKARKLAVMKALSKSVKTKNKENEDPLNNNMALPYSFMHSTPMKFQQVTDLDDVNSETDADTELTESEVCGVEGDTTDDAWSDLDEPKSVRSEMYNVNVGRKGTDIPGNNSTEGVTVIALKDLDERGKHWRSLEVLHETAEYEFCRSLEESKLFASTSSLLEEIEADLPSPYSLAKPLNHTFHTLTSYRTQTRLARMDGNLTCPDMKKQKESLEVGILAMKIDRLDMEATVQKSLAEQAEKALALSKANKVFGVEHVESEKAFLLANLRRTAVLQEVKKLRMLGEVSEKENIGQITISEICFEVDDSRDDFPGKYICTAMERENVLATSVNDEIMDGKLYFKEALKFQNLNKDFVIYIDLYKLLFKEPRKALLTSALVKKLKKVTAVNLNRSLTDSEYGRCGFVCISQCELRLLNIINSEEGKCILQNYLTGSLQHSAARRSVTLLGKTDISIKSKQCGFLNVFQDTWHRRWFAHLDYFLESWVYPEDRESDKPPVDSIYLPHCQSVEPVGLEVCIRPHSFVITMKDNNRRIFSANSHKDMLTWVNHLNLSLEQIRLWKPNA